MNSGKRAHANPFYIIFYVIAIFLAAIMVFKPVMRWFYPVKYIDTIKKCSTEYNLDENLVMAVISAESKFDENAVSQKNAKGLMQLKEKTALWCMEEFNISSDGFDIHHPPLNIQIGCAYLKYLISKFDGNIDTALAAYNAGEGNVKAWLGESGNLYLPFEIPFEETKRYVDTVNKRMKIYRFLYGRQK